VPPPRLFVCNLQTCWFLLTADMLAVFAGKQRRWDVIEAHSSVACVLYHKDMDAFLLVRQFRPAVYSCRLREAKEAGQPAPDRSAGRNSVCVWGDATMRGFTAAVLCTPDDATSYQGVNTCPIVYTRLVTGVRSPPPPNKKYVLLCLKIGAHGVRGRGLHGPFNAQVQE
jgi:hypothetical protein